MTGEPFYSFLGIPFAKPPIGNLRFQPPEPADSWDGVRDADKEGNMCTQWDLITGKTEPLGSEDCLYLNVHTPEIPSNINTKKAVMVFIHGGGFLVGSASSIMYSPDYLMNHDVIYVAIQYRLHVFGFLNLGLKNYPGNLGMKDQVLALTWIKENIDSFGGDPDNITIFGESAGGSSVHLHMLSPMSKGLFNKAIAQSGNAFSPWSYVQNPVEQGFNLGKFLGFQGNDPEELVAFLKEIPAEDIVTAVYNIQQNLKKQCPGKFPNLPFIPSVEIIKEDAFLPDLPENLLSQAEPIPFLTGFNNKEGLLIFLDLDSNLICTLVNDFLQVIRQTFKFDETKIANVTQKVEELYGRSEKEKSQKLEQLINLYTDIFFMEFFKSYEYIIKTDTPVYLYEFSYDGGLNIFKELMKKSVSNDEIKEQFTQISGAAHGDDIGYLFRTTIVDEVGEIQANDRKVIDNMCSLWTTFAKTGNPTHGMSNVEWNPCKIDNTYYLEIGEDLRLMKGNILEQRLKFWENLLNLRSKFKVARR